MNIEIAPKEYWKKLNYDNGMFYCKLLIIDGKNDWRMIREEEFIENGNRMITIEGNTNSEGSREGDSVAKKTRTATVGSGRGLILQGWFNIV